MVHPAAYPSDRLLAECETQRTRRSGPGGQHRNKVETAVILRHRPTGLSAEAGERRSQQLNHRTALFRLRLRLALEHRGPVAASDRGDPPPPSDLWRSRSRGGRIVVNPRHADFPALLAEALDAIAACEQDVKAAAGRLGVSTSQLVKFLKAAPPALEPINAHRRERGEPTLK